MGTTKDIRDAVEAELKFDPLVDDADIHVVNMSGDVALNGTVPSYPQYLEAAAAAQRVGRRQERAQPPAGRAARRGLPRRRDADHRREQRAGAEHHGAGRRGGDRAGRQPDADRHGEYGRQRKAAELAVAGLAGVRNVKDDIDISYDADPVDVTLLVQDALDRNALVDDDSDVSVDTSGNTVTLRGHVRTWAERDAVVGAAWMAGGVMQVRDDLDITG